MHYKKRLIRVCSAASAASASSTVSTVLVGWFVWRSEGCNRMVASGCGSDRVVFSPGSNSKIQAKKDPQITSRNLPKSARLVAPPEHISDLGHRAPTGLDVDRFQELRFEQRQLGHPGIRRHADE